MGENRNKKDLNLGLQEADNPEDLMGSAEITVLKNVIRKLGKCAQYLIKGQNRRCCA